jgi:hypothetical protein
MCKTKCIFDVPDAHTLAIDEHANDVEPIRFVRPAMSIDPDLGGFRQLLLFPPVDRLDGKCVLGANPPIRRGKW